MLCLSHFLLDLQELLRRLRLPLDVGSPGILNDLGRPVPYAVGFKGVPLSDVFCLDIFHTRIKIDLPLRRLLELLSPSH